MSLCLLSSEEFFRYSRSKSGHEVFYGPECPCAAIRGQILLYEPLPNINKVLSLVLQEEKQSLKNGSAMNSVMGHPIEATTLYSNANSNAKVNHGGRGNSKKDGPICSHCAFHLDSSSKGNLQPIRFLGNQVMNCCLIFLGIFFSFRT